MFYDQLAIGRTTFNYICELSYVINTGKEYIIGTRNYTRSLLNSVVFNITPDCNNKVIVNPISSLVREDVNVSWHLAGKVFYSGIQLLDPVYCPPSQLDIVRDGVP